MRSEFSVFITPSAERCCKKLPRLVADFVLQEVVAMLHEDPFAGERLAKPLAPLRSLHFSVSGQPYRAAYTVEESSDRIIIHLIGHRSDFYERLRRLLKR